MKIKCIEYATCLAGIPTLTELWWDCTKPLLLIAFIYLVVLVLPFLNTLNNFLKD